MTEVASFVPHVKKVRVRFDMIFHCYVKAMASISKNSSENEAGNE